MYIVFFIRKQYAIFVTKRKTLFFSSFFFFFLLREIFKDTEYVSSKVDSNFSV
jgi:hypothetical protein